MTGFAVGAALFILGVTNQGATPNGATLLWVAGIIIATVALTRKKPAKDRTESIRRAYKQAEQ